VECTGCVFVWWQKCFDVCGCFVVEFMEKGFEATESEPGVDLAIGTEKFLFHKFFNWNVTNCVGVVDIENDNICVAAVGHDGEAAGLISEEVAIDLVDGYENKVCAQVVGFLWDIFHGVREEVWHW
jgi:hypothetical protein